jgi:hypothetical protein
LIWTLRDEFLARSTSRDSATLAPIDQAGRPATTPTDEEYAAYIDPVSSKRWLATSSDWTCPICARSKRQLMRKSKSGKWSGGVRSIYECALERDDLTIANRQRLFPDFRNDIFVRDISQISVCADCAGISATLMQKDQSIRDPYLSCRDRRASILSSQPHRTHEIDLEAARQRAIANESYAAAMGAFHAFSRPCARFCRQVRTRVSLGQYGERAPWRICRRFVCLSPHRGHRGIYGSCQMAFDAGCQ